MWYRRGAPRFGRGGIVAQAPTPTSGTKTIKLLLDLDLYDRAVACQERRGLTFFTQYVMQALTMEVNRDERAAPAERNS